MNNSVFERLHAEGHITDTTLQNVKRYQSERLFSLYWELRLLLYLGILLLTGGLGILVYKNIDTIGHQAVLAFIALVSIGSFAYCIRKRQPFSWTKTQVADPFFDYILLLGNLSLLIFLAYWQYACDIFGDHYGLATFIPMVILFVNAYCFDHQGVLALAITNLAAWAGVTVTPLTILKAGNFANTHLIYTGILLGILLLLTGHLSLKRAYKPHFRISYTNFGLHLFFWAALSGLWTFKNGYLLWFAALALVAACLFTRAMKLKSFYFILMIVLYTYIGLSYVVCESLSSISWRDMEPILIGLIYFLTSAAAVGYFLVHINRKCKAHDSV